MTRPTTTGKAQDLITFTRSTTGTALAKISYGEELVTNGTFDNGTTGWSKSNAASSIAAVNNQLVVTLGSTYNNTYTSIATEAGKAYTASVNLISSTSAAIYIGAGTTTSSFALGLSSDIYDGTKGTITFTASGSVTFIQLHVNGSSGQQATFDNVSVKEALYDQPDGTLQLFNHPINKPRIEYDASGNCLGLLVEEARTNLCPFSESFTSTWIHNNSTLNSGVDSPNGGNNAWSITENTATSTHQVYYPSLINSTASGQSFNFSFYVKQLVGNRRVQIAFTGSAFGSEAYATFNIDSGAILTNSSMDGETSIKPVGNGWYRVSASATTNAAATGSVVLRMWNADNVGFAYYAGDGVSTLGIYGAQFEVGSFPTSYIPTNGSTVTRSADVASLAVSEFGYNQDQFSVVVESDFFADSGTRPLVYIGESNNNRILLYRGTGAIKLQVKSGNNTEVQESIYGDIKKAAFRYKKDDMVLAANGLTTSTDTSASLLAQQGLNIYIGRYNGGAPFLNGHIKSIQYYPLGLSNAQLQALTV